MSRWFRTSLYVLALVAAGLGAFTLGAYLRPATPPAGTAIEKPVLMSGFELVNQVGVPVSLAESFAGQVTLVFFGYTRCPDVCPLTMARLAHAYTELGEPDDLRVVMVTVDPGFDTPEVLNEYVARFHPDFVGLTGGNTQIAEAALAFYVGFGGVDATIAHTDTVAVLDRQGRMRYLYGQDAVVRLGDDLPALLKSL